VPVPFSECRASPSGAIAKLWSAAACCRFLPRGLARGNSIRENKSQLASWLEKVETSNQPASWLVQKRQQAAALQSPASAHGFARACNMDLTEQLASTIQGNVVVMGVGNPCRGDDAAGSLLAQLITDIPGIRVIDAQEVPENYVRQVVGERPDTVVLVDSVDLKSASGSVALLDKDQVAGYLPSTHRMPMSLLMDYLERETHARIFLIAIQPRHTAFMQPMSGEVHASVTSIAGVLNDVLRTRRIPANAQFATPRRGEVPV